MFGTYLKINACRKLDVSIIALRGALTLKAGEI
jgi:hypothetical protein